ncbi:FAD-dependent oxidoreductase [Streptomyces sp. 549]|uniref:FAD-dependent oxidoreductase n=1 Tax=Streptomyces sp. 549 TaxID=3049076 RepID=UPI0024C2EC57|nr:FAD-dependent oxidoreductase [Streptomyces sp. 549]MDK1475417.1 FAD-dependent oxidoreductase [Streptomyces sp. 549]
MPETGSNPRDTPVDAVVIGAGAAGLACAADLTAGGLRVRVLEASDGVGGRMRTDLHEGFVLDRGFQVFNTSYPQVKRRLRLRELRLRPFTPGVLIRTERGLLRFSDPTRQPRRSADLLPGRLASTRDLLALGVLSARDMLGPPAHRKRAEDHTTLTALARAGISDELVETFFRPFLSGVFLEDELETSERFFHLVWRSMLRGTLCLPEPTLLVDSAGRFLNTCVLSEVSSGHSPGSRALVATSVLGEDRPELRRALLSALADAYGTDTSGWEHLAARTVHDALPAMPPPQRLTRTTRFGPGRYVCGDHRATGSVQGALASGARAAREVLADLRSAPR